MDPNPKKFPVLSYVMARIPSLGPKHPSYSDFDEIDIERGESKLKPSSSTTGSPNSINREVELMVEMPHLNDPNILAAMTSAVSDVAQTRSILKTLGDRPDHESVDSARSKIAEIESTLSKQLEEIVLESKSNEIDLEKEKEIRQAAEKEKRIYNAVIKLDEMHESYEKLLKKAEERLLNIYRSASTSEKESEESKAPADVEMNEEVVMILQEASTKEIERVKLSDRELRFLPEAFGKIRGLVSLDLSTNQLEVSISFNSEALNYEK